MYVKKQTEINLDLDLEVPRHPSIRHYCFLVHGFLGNKEELSYVEESIQKALKKHSNDNSEVFIYKIKSNHKKTRDGIIEGGKRVAKEVLDIIGDGSIYSDRKYEADSKVIKTISFVGHSLGGLYSRYAIAEIEAKIPDHFRFNIFCTTATPHLGMSKHTYFKINRELERVVAVCLGKTGKDLFRTKKKKDIIKQMCLSSHYLTPLSHFRIRMVYSNCFGSDFPVPTKTSAFLHGPTLHRIISNIRDNRQDKDAFLFSAYTEKTYNERKSPLEIITNGKISKTDEYIQMSQSLDSLGWKKVFVDVRHLSPITHIRLLKRNSRKTLSDSLSSRTLSSTHNNLSDILSDESSTTKMSYDTELDSKELAKLLSKGDSFSIPLGHNVIIANSKNKFSARINAGGKIVMDTFADDFVQDLLNWDH